MKPKAENCSTKIFKSASDFAPYFSRRGQALVEAMVALGVLTIGLMGMFQLLSQSLALNRVVSDNYVASYLAGEGIEVVKNLIDSAIVAGGSGNWKSKVPEGEWEVQYDSVSLTAYQDRFLGYDAANHIYAYGAGSPTAYKRKIIISYVGSADREIKAVSRVTWTTRGGGVSQMEAEDHFYRWRP